MFWSRKRESNVKTRCVHPKPLPRWDTVEDTGLVEKATHYYCSACDAVLPPQSMQRV